MSRSATGRAGLRRRTIVAVAHPDEVFLRHRSAPTDEVRTPNTTHSLEHDAADEEPWSSGYCKIPDELGR